MPVTIAQFFDRLRESEVLTAAEVEELWARFPPDKRQEAAERIVPKLVERGNLTQHQTTALLEGQGRTLVLGDYVVLHKIGAGGMGQVFKARHRRMKREVALKVLPAALMADPDSIKRFQREVEAAARLTHPNIVATHDAGEQKGVHYLAMEYVNGDDLANVVRKQGPLSVDLALSYVAQAACGLAHAHKLGIIHRDIKPANLLLAPNGVVKILDMGLARFDNQIIDDSVEGLTQSGAFMGTVDYVAPEQALDSRRAGPQADMYSLGCSLFYLLTGRRMYDGDTMMLRLVAHREEPIPTLVGERGDVPADLPSIFERLVAKRPEYRFAHMEDALGALEACRMSLIKQAVPLSVETDAPVAIPQPPPSLAAPPQQFAISTGIAVESESATIVEPRRSFQHSSSLARSWGTVPARLQQTVHRVLLTGGHSWRLKAMIGGVCAVLVICVAILVIQTAFSGTPRHARNILPELANDEAVPPKSPRSLANDARAAAENSGSEYLLLKGELWEGEWPAQGKEATEKLNIAESAYEAGNYSHAAENFKEAERLFVIAISSIQVSSRDAAIEAQEYADQARIVWQAIEAKLPVGTLPVGASDAAFEWNRACDLMRAKRYRAAQRVFNSSNSHFRNLTEQGAIRIEFEKLTAIRNEWQQLIRDASPDILPRYAQEAETAYGKAYDGISRETSTLASERIAAALALFEAAKKAYQAALNDAPLRSFENSLKMKLVYIPAGEFDMGSPETERERGNDEKEHRVRLTKGIYIGAHEVTQAQFEEVLARNPSYFRKNGGGKSSVSDQNTSNFPVETVSWYDAVEFCNELSKRENLAAHYTLRVNSREEDAITSAYVMEIGGRGYRLPTEAEWEYACRAGTKTPFHFGVYLSGGEANIDGDKPYGTATKSAYLERTRAVGGYTANAFGLFDMHGNVAEWCSDWNGNYVGDAIDAKGPASGTLRIIRGGSWNSVASRCRSAFRDHSTPSTRDYYFGFRVACDR